MNASSVHKSNLRASNPLETSYIIIISGKLRGLSRVFTLNIFSIPTVKLKKIKNIFLNEVQLVKTTTAPFFFFFQSNFGHNVIYFNDCY